MSTSLRGVRLFVVSWVALAGCGGGGSTPPERTASPALAQGDGPPASAARQYVIRGQVEAVPRERVSVTLTHDEIPGIMAAMTNMEYGVAEPAVLDGLAAGDRVEGRIEARSGGYVIVALKKR